MKTPQREAQLLYDLIWYYTVETLEFELVDFYLDMFEVWRLPEEDQREFDYVYDETARTLIRGIISEFTPAEIYQFLFESLKQ